MTRAFFAVDFCRLVTKNKMGCDLLKGFFGNKKPQSHHILGETKIEFAIFRP
jgi:hypothetical protein